MNKWILFFTLLLGFPLLVLGEGSWDLKISSFVEESSAPSKIEFEVLSEKEEKALEKEEAKEGGEANDIRLPAAFKNVKKSKIKRSKSFQIPSVTKKTKKKRRRLNLKSVQPPSTAQLFYRSGDEAELERVLNEEISHLFRLLKRDRNAELTLRLGSLYVEKSRLISLKLQEDYERKLLAYKEGQRKTKPYLNLKSAQVYNRKSLKLFEDFQQNYPKHRRMDEVLFFLGFNFYQLKNPKRGIQYYSELEARFPKSPYLYEARFQLGEHYFKLAQWKSSYNYYRKVSRNKRGKFYFFALYKMAWASYKLGKVDRGLALLQKTIKEGRDFKVVSDKNQIFTFNHEAIEDLVLFYTYSKKKSADAQSYFLSLLDEKKAWELLRRLAYAYRDTSQTKAAVVLFESLIRRDPVGKDAFEYKKQIVEIVYNVGKTSDIIKHLTEWVRDYGPESAWYQANKRGGRELIQTAMDVEVRDYALKNHDTFRRSRSPRAKKLATAFYQLFFENFKKSKFSAEMRFFYAELLFDSKKYVSAVKSYEEVITNFPSSKFRKGAFDHQMLALEKILPKDAKIKEFVGKGDDPVSFPKSVISFLQVADRYLKQFPRAENAPYILYQMAILHYKFNQFGESAQLFKRLSDEYPESKQAAGVGGILLDIYNKNKDYKALEELALSLSQRKNVDREVLKEVQSVLEQLSLKKARDLNEKEKYEESAKLYEKFARSNPSSPHTPSAFYNAGLNFEKAKDSLSAISMYSAVLTYKSEKHKKIRKDSQKFLPVLYEKLGFYKKAADSYVSFAKNHPSDPKSSDFWYNAGVIFDGLADTGSALFSYEQHLKLSQKPDRHEVLYLMGLMFEKSRSWQKVISYYKSYLKSPSSNKQRLVKASFRLAEIYQTKLRNPTQAEIWHKKTLGLYKRLRAGVSYGARSHFYIAKNIYTQFSNVKIPANPQRQKQAVAKKLELLKNLDKSLKPVIRYDDGESIIASLSLIGQANKEMAEAIYRAPIPKGLDKKGRAQYRAGIKKIIQPYVEKSVQHYELALKKSSKLEVYSEWIGKAYRGLSSLDISSQGKFRAFHPVSIPQEVFHLSVLDDTGTVAKGFFQDLTKTLKYGVSREDFDQLSRAMASRQEEEVLKACSRILNKDPDNVIAINSLAYFYMSNKRWRLGALILNRIASKTQNTEVIHNNLAVFSLRYGYVREAMTYLKKALDADSSFHTARVNMGNIFIRHYDYDNAYKYYKDSQSVVVKRWPISDRNTVSLLSNWGVALTGARKWEQGLFVFKNLSTNSSPLPEILFNYGVFLSEKSRFEDRSNAKESLLEAKELAEELTLSVTSNHLKRKVRLLSKSISVKLKKRGSRSLKTKSQRRQGK